ncbi:MAG: TlpA family protein disulfide reductase [Coriobacteriales bacterium]|nr:TlpA family protein disulfide reductase [Coriobacteriales bacterium]
MISSNSTVFRPVKPLMAGILAALLGLACCGCTVTNTTPRSTSQNGIPAHSQQTAGNATADQDNSAATQSAGSSQNAAGAEPSPSADTKESAAAQSTEPAPGGVVYPDGDTTGVLEAAYDFELVDQYGTTHKLADYRGKIIFLNFWTTWCGYCVQEMPDIQQLYLDNGSNEGDVIILGVANPSTAGHPNNSDESLDKVLAKMDELGVTYPVLMDTTGAIFNEYKIYYLPTTYMIDPYGNVFGYVPGGLTRTNMDKIIDLTLAGDLSDRTSSK